jgi:hypothetical protein
MRESSSPAAAPQAPDADADPEAEALLGFDPVKRHTRRHDGWSPELQRGFVAALVRLGNVDRAAHEVGRTASGAWTLRNAAGAGEFADAWDAALALYHLRNPKPGPVHHLTRKERLAQWRAGGTAGPRDDDAPLTREEEQERLEFFDRFCELYWRNLTEERTARLDGRVVEADFAVRQLAWMEVVISLGGHADTILQGLMPDCKKPHQVVATPLSWMIGEMRRDFWREKGEPERPAPSPFAPMNDRYAQWPGVHYSRDRDGPDFKAWERRQAEEHAHNAQALRLWEEKARADAAQWRARLETEGDDQKAQP